MCVEQIRALRWFGDVERMDEYRMAKNGVDGGSKWMAGATDTEIRLNGWCEGGLGQRDDDGGCASIRERVVIFDDCVCVI